MDKLYFQQTELAEEINKILISFNKDSVDLKNLDYCKKRLDLLESYWKNYQINDDKLIPYESSNHKYFVNAEFQRTKNYYLKAKQSISDLYDELLLSGRQKFYPQQKDSARSEEAGPSMSQNSQGATVSPTFKSTGVTSKVDDMMHKQYIHFKAFKRAVSNIDVETIVEKWEFEDALSILQNRWSVIDKLHWEIIGEVEYNESYEHQFTEHEKIFNSMKRELNKKMYSTSYREKSTPQIEIPVFLGSFQQWVSFKDLFNEAIHKNPSLSNAQKMQFLKSKVKGEAERLIQHLQISSENYSTCWEILNHRFNNKKLIFTSHANVFLNLPNMQQQSLAAIKKLHDVTLKNLHAIKNLGVDISTWDPLLVHILSQKLDSESYSEYINSLKNSRELPILQDFINFLESKFTALESSRRFIPKLHISQQPSDEIPNKSTSFPNSYRNSKTNKSYNYWNYNTKPEVTKAMHVSAVQCPLCSAEHNLSNCKNFLDLSNDAKLKTLQSLRYCVNCIYNHNGNKCHSTKRCRTCSGHHHTLLHDCFAGQQTPNYTASIAKQQSFKKLEQNIPVTNNNATNASQHNFSEVLLATALIKVTASDSTSHVMRALIDQGSQTSLITERAAQVLGLKRQMCKGSIFGVGEQENTCKGKLNITCQSIYTDFKFNADVLIMNNLIKNLPTYSFKKPNWQHLAHLSLADPEFYVSRPVDLLLGADIYSIIMLDGIIRGHESSQPVAQHTQLGWLLCGSVKTFHCNVVLNNIEDIQQFWKIEDINEQNDMSAEDQECLNFYQATTKRLENGRYEVRLPLKQQAAEKLGSSKEIAIAQFKNLERKLNKQENLAKQYKQFMSEYEQLKHMKLATSSKGQLECFLPHHAVQREEATTTKLRLVFNAAARTSSGISLNEVMHKGSNLQQDLQGLILKWRQYPFVFRADIEKMYRQILVNEADQKLQQIVWRDNQSEPIKFYQLTTLTYGTNSAPFIAMMTLRRLADDEQTRFPTAAQSIKEEFYMDDWISGSYTIEEGKQKIAEVNECLSSGGFLLRKWSSNVKELLCNVNQSKQQTSFTFKPEMSAKTLGIRWNPIEDEFTFQCDISTTDTAKLTKRLLLSEISKLFDPLGWLAPLTTKLKLLFQKVWQDSKIQWSSEVPDAIKEEWTRLRSDLTSISQFKIPRWLHNQQNDVIELHGFCDSSCKAYACVVYARTINQTCIKASTVLVAAKSRLIPKNKHVSLPRLELCAAELLSKLMAKTVSSLKLNCQIFGWTDSKVTLSWIQGTPDRWKPFVANRVKKITTTMPPADWHYVNTKENPADAASRGLTSTQLKEHALWWQGPSWLADKDFTVKEKQTGQFQTQEEIRKQTNVIQNSIPENSIVENLLNRHSSLIKITRILAWILRALTPNYKQKPKYITLQELRKTKQLIIKDVQQKEFSLEINDLSNNKLSSTSKLLSLNPFLDQDKILRVGGRLKNANISADMKYPIIIPYSSRLTQLIIQQAHELTFHGGARLTSSYIRHQYWIIKGNRAVKKQLQNCVTCKKQEPRREHQLMGDLPDCRTNPAPPFYHTGLDNTGFIPVKASKGRGIRTSKGYITLFICMVTKAVHLELVSDLSSSAFLAALRRMAARRGAPKHMYSDNGTNFVGSNRIIQEEYEQIKQIFDDTFHKEIAEMEIEWHFNCPSWPSAGGVWERSIRSLKQHLKRVIGEQALTFEEYSTVLAQIEACLNSRPLCPISEDINDLDFLTPAHFLTNRAGLTVIETPQDARTRWHLTSKVFHDIWKRWKTEYLSLLSVRPKWLKAKQNIKVGDLVTIHDNLPAGKWPVGRVTEVHPGQDGIVRVVTLKTKNGYIKRPIVKLSILPIQNNQLSTEQPLAASINL